MSSAERESNHAGDGRVRSARSSGGGSLKQANVSERGSTSRPTSSSLKNPATSSASAAAANSIINDKVLSRFIEIQSQIESYESKGVFERLRLVEEDVERLEKSKRQAEINHKVLDEQTKKEKQDFENISQPTVQSFFKSKQAHSMAISKEQVCG